MPASLTKLTEVFERIQQVKSRSSLFYPLLSCGCFMPPQQRLPTCLESARHKSFFFRFITNQYYCQSRKFKVERQTNNSPRIGSLTGYEKQMFQCFLTKDFKQYIKLIHDFKQCSEDLSQLFLNHLDFWLTKNRPLYNCVLCTFSSVHPLTNKTGI